jgi:hypothetical protein
VISLVSLNSLNSLRHPCRWRSAGGLRLTGESRNSRLTRPRFGKPGQDDRILDSIPDGSYLFPSYLAYLSMQTEGPCQGDRL